MDIWCTGKKKYIYGNVTRWPLIWFHFCIDIEGIRNKKELQIKWFYKYLCDYGKERSHYSDIIIFQDRYCFWLSRNVPRELFFMSVFNHFWLSISHLLRGKKKNMSASLCMLLFRDMSSIWTILDCMESQQRLSLTKRLKRVKTFSDDICI